jgi:hypothetical protein
VENLFLKELFLRGKNQFYKKKSFFLSIKIKKDDYTATLKE